jgi:hypothetical protein
MKLFSRTIITTALALTLLSSATITSGVTYASTTLKPVPVVNELPLLEKEETIEPMWKVKVAKESVIALAKGIDGQLFTKIINASPKSFHATLNKSRDGMVTSLNNLAKRAEIGEEAVQNALVQAILNNTSASSSTANNIANIIVFAFL